MASQQQNGNGSTGHIGDVLEDVVPEQSATTRPIGTDGLRTGLGALDDLLGDLPYCEIVGVVGRCRCAPHDSPQCRSGGGVGLVLHEQ